MPFSRFISAASAISSELQASAGKLSADKELHPDLAERLAGEASKTAEHFLEHLHSCALDYCPPVDIRFGEFLRAMITADFDLVSDDPIGYRAALIDAFRSARNSSGRRNFLCGRIFAVVSARRYKRKETYMRRSGFRSVQTTDE